MITDIWQTKIWATTSTYFHGTVTMGPFSSSHVRARTSLEKVFALSDGSLADT